MMNRIWEKCAEFHGHECGGLTLGYKAALFMADLLGLPRDEDGCVSADADIVCMAENNACSVDAIRVILGCTEEKGNLLFHLTGEQAYTCVDRRKREMIRIVLKDRPEGLTREQSFSYYQSREPWELFEKTPMNAVMPQWAGSGEEYVCSVCGEKGNASWFRFVNGKALCMDCFAEQNDAT